MAESLTTILTSGAKTVEINRANPTVIIGERINQLGEKIAQGPQAGGFRHVRRDAERQVAAGAKILDVNAGVPGADEVELLNQVLTTVMETTEVPLCIDTADPEALEAALSIYEGKPLVNSVNGEERSLEAVLPLVKEYGTSVIGLCMDDEGIPPTAQDRFEVAAKIIERASKLGIPPSDVIIDPLALTMGSDHNSGKIALETTQSVVAEFGVNVTMGVSNISFGMPARHHINATFIAMAILAGLTCPITNPLEPEVKIGILAADLSMGRDEYGMNWIKAFRQRQKEAADNDS